MGVAMDLGKNQDKPTFISSLIRDPPRSPLISSINAKEKLASVGGSVSRDQSLNKPSVRKL